MGKKYMVYDGTLWEPYLNFQYTGLLLPFTLEPATYLFVANGARGGGFPKGVASNFNQFVSWGGTTYGILDLDHTQTFYVNVGGNGGDFTYGETRALGGYNGGGNGGLSSYKDDTRPNGCGGGGATDVRLNSIGTAYKEINVTAPTGLVQVEYLTNALGDKEYIYSEFYGPDSDEALRNDPLNANSTKANGIRHSWLSLNYVPKSYSEIECKVWIDTSSLNRWKTARTEAHLFGLGKNMYLRSYVPSLNGASFVVGEDNKSSTARNVNIPTDQEIIIRIPANSATCQILNPVTREVYLELTVDDVERVDDYESTPNRNIFYFNSNEGLNYETGEYGWSRFYEMKIWENGELVRWYVPVRTSELDKGWGYFCYKRGVFDLVTETYCQVQSMHGPKSLWISADDYYGNIGDADPSPSMLCGNAIPSELEEYHHKKIVPVPRGVTSRIFVAGGGGGTSVQYNTGVTQDYMSYGGGPISGTIAGPNITEFNNGGLRATQSSGYSYGQGQHAEDKDQARKGASTMGTEGQGGGGGGWYGGYSVIDKRYTTGENIAYGGTGGSSYILTADSYKPEGYLDGFEDLMPSLYFRNGLMLPYQAFEGPSFTVYKVATHQPVAGDRIRVPYTGSWQSLTLIPSSYKFKCYGGDGSARYNNADAAKGGYVEGVLDLQETTQLFFHVGSSAYIIATKADNEAQGRQIFDNKATYDASPYPYNYSTPERTAALVAGGETSIRTEQDGNITGPVTVPEGTDEVEYLESDATQYFTNTGGIIQDGWDIECVCELLEPTDYRECIFGTWGSSPPSASYYNRGLAVLPVYARGDERVAFLCGTSMTVSGYTMPRNQKIKITIVQNVLTWYDMDGNVLGTITSGSSRSFSTPTNLFLFECTNGNGGTDPMGIKCNARIYSFKVIKRSDNSLQRYLVACSNQSDELGPKFFNLVSRTAYTRVNTGNAFVAGPVVTPKTEIVSTYSNSVRSRNSRFIVAGGGGAQGSPIGLGGHGGGMTGGDPRGTSTYGTNNGGGGQSSGFMFGIGGIGSSLDNKHLGAGGYGWYGGYATTSAGSSNNDENKGGAGGSGYVLTADSYKPDNYIPDETFWMRDIFTMQGGNSERGITRIEIEVVESPPKVLSVLAKDQNGYKAYDDSTNSWYSITVTGKITPQHFVDYGVAIDVIVSDDGLSFPFQFCICDSYATGISGVYTKVLPPTQHVLIESSADISAVKSSCFDAELDDNVTVNVTGTLNGSVINTDITIDMNDVPEKKSTLYMLQYRVRSKSSAKYQYNPPKKTIENIGLYSTQPHTSIPYTNKPLASEDMPDGKDKITTVKCASACEYNRNIYYILALNNKVLRLEKYNIFTNMSDIVRDDIAITRLSSTGAVGGSLFIKDDVAYISNSDSVNKHISILAIPLDENEAIVKYSDSALGNDPRYYMGANGQSHWYDETKRLFCTANGFMLFDTEERSFEFKPNSVNLDNPWVMSFAVGDYSIMTFVDGLTTTCNMYAKSDFSYISNTGIILPEDLHVVTYDQGYFYIGQMGHIYVYKDQSNHKPTFVKDIVVPEDVESKTPIHIVCTDGCLYIIYDGTDIVCAYNLASMRWTELTLPYEDMILVDDTIHRPVGFRGYFFVPEKQLFVTNANMYSKYRIGENNSYIHIRTNSEEIPGTAAYDYKFISVDEAGLHIHTGYLYKQLTTTIDLQNRIFSTSDYVEGEYKRMLSNSYTEPDDEEV